MRTPDQLSEGSASAISDRNRRRDLPNSVRDWKQRSSSRVIKRPARGLMGESVVVQREVRVADCGRECRCGLRSSEPSRTRRASGSRASSGKRGRHVEGAALAFASGYRRGALRWNGICVLFKLLSDRVQRNLNPSPTRRRSLRGKRGQSVHHLRDIEARGRT